MLVRTPFLAGPRLSRLVPGEFPCHRWAKRKHERAREASLPEKAEMVYPPLNVSSFFSLSIWLGDWID